jgi:SAM-dependent methyltransferase
VKRASDDRPGDIPAAFDTGAASYDVLVNANPGYHAHLRMSARRMGLPDGGRGLRLLDAGCGTGASTAALLAVAPDAEIIAVDGSSGMLAEARSKRWPSTVRFVRSHVEDLADAGIDGPFDGILAAYLVRNLTDPDATLRTFMAGRARVFGARLDAGHRDVERGVHHDHHPERQAPQRRCQPVPVPASQRERFRWGSRLPGSVAHQRVHRRAR